MIVKFSILLMPILFIHFVVLSQPRHVKGIDMLGLYAGKGPFETSFGVSYQKYLTTELSFKANTSANQVYFTLSNDRVFDLHPQILYSLLSNKRQIYLNVFAGLRTGMEVLKNSIFNQKVNNLFVGESLGLNMEYFLSSHLKIDFAFEQQFLQHSKISDYQYGFTIWTYINL